MILRLVLTLALSVSVFFSPALAQDKNKRAVFDAQAAFGYVEALAADAMLGRKSGELGGGMAAEYIVMKLREWGLEPAGSNSSFYQDLTIEYNEPEKGAALEVLAHGKKRDFVYGEDWRQQRYSGSGHLAAPLVFIGYGISAPQKQYDDYSGLDVKGKLVLLSTDTPPGALGEKLRDEARFESRVKAARARGERGPHLPGDTQTAGSSAASGAPQERSLQAGLRDHLPRKQGRRLIFTSEGSCATFPADRNDFQAPVL
jgi:hypothetical protein